jgi:superfamily II DNA or RNA helicase
MSNKATIDYFRSRGLLPFQAEFARDFCAADSPSYWELVATAGTGKTFLSHSIVAYQMESGARRVLVLAPRALLTQWQHVLTSSSGTVDPLLVDRRTYLELEASVPSGHSPWPEPAIILMSIDLAKRRDMTASLTTVEWDLVVIDEGHLLTGQRQNLAEKLMEGGRAKRALFLTAIAREPVHEINRRVWRLEDLVDWGDKSLFTVLTRRLETVEYQRTEQEQHFLRALEKSADELGKRIAAGRIRRLLETWRPMRNRLAHGMGVTADDLKDSQLLLDSAIDESESLEVPEQLDINIHDLMFLYREFESLLERIVEISTDSKLDTLSVHLARQRRHDGAAHVCIWTSFVSTVQYLTSSLEDLDVPLFVLTGAVDPETRRQRVDQFRENGGILITTDVAADESAGGIALGYVDQCVNYDLPESPEHFEQRWGRFFRIDRTTDFEMVLLRDTSKSLAWEEQMLKLLGQSS